MAGNAGVAFVEILPRASTFGRQLTAQLRTAFSRQVQPTLTGITKQAETGVSKLSAGSIVAIGAIGAVGAAAFAGISKSVGTTLHLADEVRTLSRQLGITTEEASRLRFAGEELGISTEDLTRGFGFFEKNLVNIAPNLAKYGIALKNVDGTQKGFDQLLGEAADKYVSLGGGIQGAAFAMNVFGRGGKTLIPLLRQGSAGIKAMSEEADKLGVVMSADDVEAARQLQLATRELDAAFQGVELRLGTAIIPLLTKLVQVAKPAVVVFGDWVAGLTAGFKGAASAARDLTEAQTQSILVVGEAARARLAQARADQQAEAAMNAFGNNLRVRRGEIRDFVTATGQDWHTFIEDAQTAANAVGDNAEQVQRDFIDKQIVGFRTWRRQLASDFDFVGQAFQNLDGSSRHTAGGILKNLDKQLQVARTFRQNIDLISTTFGDRAKPLLDQLAQMGTQGATIAAALGKSIRSGNKKVVDEIISDLKSGAKVGAGIGKDLADSIVAPLNDIKALLEAIAKHWGVTIGIDVEGLAGLRAAAADVNSMLGAGFKISGNINRNLTTHAKGTRNAPRGWRLVGEQGPELEYDAHGGGTILPYPITRKIMAGAPGFAAGAGWSGLTKDEMRDAVMAGVAKGMENLPPWVVNIDGYRFAQEQRRAAIRRAGGGRGSG